MPKPIPQSGTRISYAGRLGVGAHPEATKYVGTVLTGVVGPPCTAPRLKGWVCTYPDTVRYHGAGVDPADVEPTAPEVDATLSVTPRTSSCSSHDPAADDMGDDAPAPT